MKTTKKFEFLNLNGVNNYILYEGQDFFDNSTGFIIDTWLYLKDAKPGQVIYSNNNNYYNRLDVNMDQDALYLSCLSSNNQTSIKVLLTDVINDWFHLAICYDAKNGVSIYLNGKLTNQNPFTYQNSFQVTNFIIGGKMFYYNNTNQYLGFLNGKIAIFRVWNSRADKTVIPEYLMFSPYDYSQAGLPVIFEATDGKGSATLANSGNAIANNTYLQANIMGDVLWEKCEVPFKQILTNKVVSFNTTNDWELNLPCRLTTETLSYTIEYWMCLKNRGNLTLNFAKTLFLNYYFDNASSLNIRFNNGINVDIDLDLDMQWHHWAIVADNTAGNITLLIDGVEHTHIKTVRIQQPVGDLIFSNENSSVEVEVSELRIWNIARSADQINKIMYERADSSESSLLAYYPFNSNGAFNDKSSKCFIPNFYYKKLNLVTPNSGPFSTIHLSHAVSIKNTFYLRVNQPLNENWESYTCGAWINLNHIQANQVILTAGPISIYYENGTATLRVYGNTIQSKLGTSMTWLFWFFTYDNSQNNLKFYVGDILIGSLNMQISSLSDSSISIGTDQYYSQNDFRISGFSVWNRAMSKSVMDFFKYRRLTGFEPNLKRYWDMDNMRDGLITDTCDKTPLFSNYPTNTIQPAVLNSNSQSGERAKVLMQIKQQANLLISNAKVKANQLKAQAHQDATVIINSAHQVANSKLGRQKVKLEFFTKSKSYYLNPDFSLNKEETFPSWVKDPVNNNVFSVSKSIPAVTNFPANSILTPNFNIQILVLENCNITISALIYKVPNYRNMFIFSSTDENNNGISLSINTNKQLVFRDASGVDKVSNPISIDNEWHYVTVIYNRDMLYIDFYVDMQLISRVNTSYRIKNIYNKNCSPGINVVNNSDSFEGYMAELRVYSSSEPPQQLQSQWFNYNPLATPQLRAYWNLRSTSVYPFVSTFNNLGGGTNFFISELLIYGYPSSTNVVPNLASYPLLFNGSTSVIDLGNMDFVMTGNGGFVIDFVAKNEGPGREGVIFWQNSGSNIVRIVFNTNGDLVFTYQDQYASVTKAYISDGYNKWTCRMSGAADPRLMIYLNNTLITNVSCLWKGQPSGQMYIGNSSYNSQNGFIGKIGKFKIYGTERATNFMTNVGNTDRLEYIASSFKDYDLFTPYYGQNTGNTLYELNGNKYLNNVSWVDDEDLNNMFFINVLSLTKNAYINSYKIPSPFKPRLGENWAKTWAGGYNSATGIYYTGYLGSKIYAVDTLKKTISILNNVDCYITNLNDCFTFTKTKAILLTNECFMSIDNGTLNVLSVNVLNYLRLWEKGTKIISCYSEASNCAYVAVKNKIYVIQLNFPNLQCLKVIQSEKDILAIAIEPYLGSTLYCINTDNLVVTYDLNQNIWIAEMYLQTINTMFIYDILSAIRNGDLTLRVHDSMERMDDRIMEKMEEQRKARIEVATNLAKQQLESAAKHNYYLQIFNDRSKNNQNLIAEKQAIANKKKTELADQIKAKKASNAAEKKKTEIQAKKIKDDAQNQGNAIQAEYQNQANNINSKANTKYNQANQVQAKVNSVDKNL